MSTYNDFARLFVPHVTVFGKSAPWGLVKHEPEGDFTIAQFYTPSLRPTSGESMSRHDEWIDNDGFYNSDGSMNRIYVIKQILNGPNGAEDITVPGGPQRYVLNEIPDYDYSIWTHGRIEQNVFSHSQWWGVPRMVTNPYWRGEGSNTRLCIEMREEWYEAVNGIWTMIHCRTAYHAQNTGTIWLVDDHLHDEQFGMIDEWDY